MIDKGREHILQTTLNKKEQQTRNEASKHVLLLRKRGHERRTSVPLTNAPKWTGYDKQFALRKRSLKWWGPGVVG
eukprot:211844-Amphidinium_carterae.1